MCACVDLTVCDQACAPRLDISFQLLFPPTATNPARKWKPYCERRGEYRRRSAQQCRSISEFDSPGIAALLTQLKLHLTSLKLTQNAYNVCARVRVAVVVVLRHRPPASHHRRTGYTNLHRLRRGFDIDNITMMTKTPHTDYMDIDVER